MALTVDDLLNAAGTPAPKETPPSSGPGALTVDKLLAAVPAPEDAPTAKGKRKRPQDDEDLYDAVHRLAGEFGVKPGSGYRDRKRNAAVGGASGSFHTFVDEAGRPRGRDFTGSPEALKRFAEAIATRYAGHPQLRELFYDPWGGYKNGKRIPAIGKHGDHLHVGLGLRQGETARSSRYAVPGTEVGDTLGVTHAVPPKAPAKPTVKPFGVPGGVGQELFGGYPAQSGFPGAEGDAAAQAEMQRKAETTLPPKQQAALAKVRAGKATQADRQVANRAEEQVAAIQGAPLHPLEIRRRKLFGPGSINPRTLAEAAPPSGVAAVFQGLDDALTGSTARKSYERYRDAVAKGQLAAPPVLSEKPDERGKQLEDLARVRKWAMEKSVAPHPQTGEPLEWVNGSLGLEAALREPGDPNYREYQGRYALEREAFEKRMKWLRTPAAAKALGVTTQFGKQLLKSMSDERLNRLMGAKTEAETQVAEGVVNIASSFVGPGVEGLVASKAAAPLVAGLGRGAGRLASPLGEGAANVAQRVTTRTLPGVVSGGVEGGLQQAGTAYAGGERDLRKLGTEAVIGTGVGGVLGFLGNLIPANELSPAEALQARRKLQADTAALQAQVDELTGTLRAGGALTPAAKKTRAALAAAQAKLAELDGALPEIERKAAGSAPVEPPAGTERLAGADQRLKRGVPAPQAVPTVTGPAELKVVPREVDAPHALGEQRPAEPLGLEPVSRPAVTGGAEPPAPHAPAVAEPLPLAARLPEAPASVAPAPTLSLDGPVEIKTAKSGRVKIGELPSIEPTTVYHVREYAQAAAKGDDELSRLRTRIGEDAFEEAAAYHADLEKFGVRDETLKAIDQWAAAREAEDLGRVQRETAAAQRETRRDGKTLIQDAKGGPTDGQGGHVRVPDDYTDDDLQAIYQQLNTPGRQKKSYVTGDSQGTSLRDLIFDHRMVPADAYESPKAAATRAGKAAAEAAKVAVDVDALAAKAPSARARSQADVAEAKAKLKAALDAIEVPGKLFSGVAPDPEEAVKFAKSLVPVARALVDLGYATAKDLTAALREAVGNHSDAFFQRVVQEYEAAHGPLEGGSVAEAPEGKIPSADAGATGDPPKSEGSPASANSTTPVVDSPINEKPEGIALKNAETAAQRKRVYLKDLPGATPEKMAEWADEAAEKGLPAKMGSIADEVLSGKRSLLTKVEEVGMAGRLAELEGQWNAQSAAAKKAIGTDGELEAANALAETIDEIDRITRAAKTAGSEIGRALAARKAYVDDRYSFTGIWSETTHGLQRPMVKEEREAVQQYAARVTELEGKIQQLEGDLRRQMEQAAQQSLGEELTLTAPTGTNKREWTARRLQQARKTRQGAVEAAKAKLQAAAAAAQKDLAHRSGVPRSGGPGMRSGAVLNPVAELHDLVKAASRFADVVPEVVQVGKAVAEELALAGAVKAGDVAEATARTFREAGIPMTADEALAVLAGKVKPTPRQAEEKVLSDFERVRREMRDVFREAEEEAKVAVREAIAEDQAAKREAKAWERRRLAREAREAREAEAGKLRAAKAKLAEEQRAWEKGERAKAKAAREEVARLIRESQPSEKQQARVKASREKSGRAGQMEKLADELERLDGTLNDLRQGVVKPQRTSKPKPPLYDAELMKMHRERDQLRAEIDSFKRQKARQGELEKMSPAERVVNGVADVVLGLQKDLMSSGDLQALFLQGGTALYSDNKQWRKAWVDQFRGMRQRGFDELMTDARLSGMFDRAVAAKLEMPGTGHGLGGEDLLVSDVIGNLGTGPIRKLGPVPIWNPLDVLAKTVGGYFRTNRRLYDSAMTSLRLGMFDRWVSAVESPDWLASKLGATPAPLTPEGERVIADAINTMTGRGGAWVPHVGGWVRLAYAMRYTASMVETAWAVPTWKAVAYGKRTGDWRPARVIASKQLQGWAGQMATLAGLAAAAEKWGPKDEDGKPRVRVETDLASANYGKLIYRAERGKQVHIPLASPQLQTWGLFYRAGLAMGGFPIRSTNNKTGKGQFAANQEVGKFITGKASPAVKDVFTIMNNLRGPGYKEFGQNLDLRTDEGRWNFVWRKAPMVFQGMREVNEGNSGREEGGPPSRWMGRLGDKWKDEDGLTWQEKVAFDMLLGAKDVDVKK